MKLLKDVLKEIKPTKEEEKKVLDSVNSVLKRINKNLRYAKAVLGGSGEKGTWLKGLPDMDIFVLFDYERFKNKSNKLSDILEKRLRKSFHKLIRIHGSRDYFQIKEKDFTYEIVPILDIKKPEHAKNITDMSPLHTLWVKKHKKFVDEIRLTKKFCKSADVYGAESYIQGFSGYICEILTVYYKGFLNLVRNAAKWREKVIIDIKGYYKNKDVLMELNKSKTYSPLIVIDPVQKDRNAAAALNKGKFEKFRLNCKNFLKKPSKTFFEEKKTTIEELRKKAKKNKLIIINIKVPKGKEDIVGCRLLKDLKLINKELINLDFKVKNFGWSWDKKDKAFFYFITDKKELPLEKEWAGPPLNEKEHVKVFKKKYKNIFIKKNRVYTILKRKFTKPENCVSSLIKDKTVKCKIKEVKIL